MCSSLGIALPEAEQLVKDWKPDPASCERENGPVTTSS
jgi:hypothetical protein